jgi:hypothetical protein
MEIARSTTDRRPADRLWLTERKRLQVRPLLTPPDIEEWRDGASLHRDAQQPNV